ncbi:hypothetical protein, partial [Ralstonia pseudosolanacearum]|uniref:hypothetical protein n=1 Tax=Ralstonia pseudosolanacearum TaxID=1310165 RepID=UPI003CF98052
FRAVRLSELILNNIEMTRKPCLKIAAAGDAAAMAAMAAAASVEAAVAISAAAAPPATGNRRARP